MYFLLSIQMNILTLYNNCYVILTTYMLDSSLEPSCYLSTNLLLSPWILKLIVDMVNYSTPLKWLKLFVDSNTSYHFPSIDIPIHTTGWKLIWRTIISNCDKCYQQKFLWFRNLVLSVVPWSYNSNVNSSKHLLKLKF